MSDSPTNPKLPRIDGLPWPLNKALSDSPFEYLVMLRNGAVVVCEGAKQANDDESGWITLFNAKVIYPVIESPFNFERGLCVRIIDIVAAADAPHGS